MASAQSQVPSPPPLIEDSFDVEWENTLTREPYDVELWLEYAADKNRRGLTPSAIAMVFERALARLPGSYKIWNAYLKARRSWITECPATPGLTVVADLNATFERCLVFMNKMPNIWLAYSEFLVEQRSITAARQTFDRALYALPVSQHARIWDAYSHFVITIPEVPWQTAERVLKRRCIVDPDEGRAALIAFLRSRGRYGEAARELTEVLQLANDEDTRQQIRAELIALARSHPDECRVYCDLTVICDAIPKDAHDERVSALMGLADFHIRLGDFDQSREVFETILRGECDDSIREFSTVFEMYSKFEEAVLDDLEEQQKAEAAGKEDLEEETRFRLKRMRNLLNRRAKMSGTIFLKAWRGDVKERLALTQFYEQQKAFADAEQIVLEAFPDSEPVELINGRGSSLFLWLADAAGRREGVSDPLKAQDRILALGCSRCWEMRDAVDLWRARIELYIETNVDRALRLAREAITPLSSSTEDNTAEDGVNKKKRRPSPHRSPQLWAIYLDLEESCGTMESARAAYEQAMEIRVCSVWNILNYCKLLRKHNYHEDSYVVFERAVAMFPWPHVKDLWIEYSKQFVERYRGTKVERTRDLFEQCIASVPESAREHAQFVFFAYTQFEETYGLSRRAMNVYERWSGFVPDAQKLDAFMMWASKSAELFGAPAARQVYEKAINVLPELDVAKICVRFADTECKLGELERARAIFKHGSQFSDPADPKKDVGLWQAWNDFEVKYGNEETFREMLRVKRSVQAHFGILHAVDTVVVPSQKPPPAAVAPVAKPLAKNPTPAVTPDVESHVVDTNEIDIDDE